MAAKYEDIIKQIGEGKFASTYFLYGVEPFFIDDISKKLEDSVIDPAMRDFNQSVFYGKDSSAAQVIDALRRYPMMSDRQLVVLKEAQMMNRFEDLLPYFENPSEQSIFVINFKKKPDKRKSIFKKILKQSTSLESKALYDNQVPTWINSYLKTFDRKIAPESTHLLAQYLGTNLSKIANELQKLLINIEEDKTIGNDDIEKYIGISKDYNIFELQKALSMGNLDKVFQIVSYFQANPKDHPMQLLTASLNGYFYKLIQLHLLKTNDSRTIMSNLGLSSPFFVKEYLQAKSRYDLMRLYKISDILLEYDLKSKGYLNGETPAESLIQEMMMKIVL